MKLSSIAAAFLCGALYLSNYILAAKVVAYNVTRALPKNRQASLAGLSRRGNVDETLFNNVSMGGYFASVQVGTAAQTLMLLLSTGSSDVWVIDASSSICNSSGGCITPFYPNKSQTISTVQSGGFDISYVDGTQAIGDYIKDEFAVGPTYDARMVLQMGLVTETSTNVGIMGIGYDKNEATSVQYQNFMDEMVNDGLTNTKLYSLWLNDLDSSTGSILFGGIDTEKYYGALYSMSIHPNASGQYTTFNVSLTSISFASQAGSAIPITDSSFSVPVVLESSTTLIYLPDEIVEDIYRLFNVSVVSIDGDNYPFIDCKYSNSSSMSFGFESGSVINVAYTEIINKFNVPTPVSQLNLSFTDVCFFGIIAAGSNPNILGDFFLRSAYVVFDLTNNLIGIAQSNLNSTTSNITEIPSGAASIPHLTGVALPNPTTASSSPTSSPTSSSGTQTSSSSPTSTPKKNHAVAIGVGVAVPVAAILATFAGFFFWRRRRTISQTASGPGTLAELGDTSHNAGPVPAGMKDNSEGSEGYYNAAAFGRVSQMSNNPSELSSDPASPASPRNSKQAIERKPVPTTGEGLPTHWEQGNSGGFVVESQ